MGSAWLYFTCNRLSQLKYKSEGKKATGHTSPDEILTICLIPPRESFSEEKENLLLSICWGIFIIPQEGYFLQVIGKRHKLWSELLQFIAIPKRDSFTTAHLGKSPIPTLWSGFMGYGSKILAIWKRKTPRRGTKLLWTIVRIKPKLIFLFPKKTWIQCIRRNFIPMPLLTPSMVPVTGLYTELPCHPSSGWGSWSFGKIFHADSMRLCLFNQCQWKLVLDAFLLAEVCFFSNVMYVQTERDI